MEENESRPETECEQDFEDVWSWYVEKLGVGSVDTWQDFRSARALVVVEAELGWWQDDAHARLRGAVENLRSASTVTERRAAARDFLAALGELIACLLRFLVRVLILLLSRLLGRAAADDVPVWKPEPIDTSPQITPRGPNPAFRLHIHRGGFHRSVFGSAVPAA